MERYLGVLLIIILTIFAKNFWQAPAVLGQSSSSPTETLLISQPVTTESSFIEKLQEETEVLVKKVVFEDDPETDTLSKGDAYVVQYSHWSVCFMC